MPTLFGRTALIVASSLVLGTSACSTAVYSTPTLAFDEAEKDASEPDAGENIEALPAQVDASLELIDLDVSPCATGCGRDREDKSSSGTQPDSSTQETDTTDTQRSTESQAPRQKIDYLFVIDNSGSMKEEQQALAASVPGFIASIEAKLDMAVDVHAGVILTGEINHFSRNFGSECERIGSLLRETDGPDSSRRQCYPDGRPKYSTSATDLAAELDCALHAGTGGSGQERPMDALLGALSPKLVESKHCNKGFFRKDAMLVITLLTDEEDDRLKDGSSALGSKGNPKEWTRRLIELRGGNKESVVVLGLIGTKDSTCDPLITPGQEPSEFGAEISRRLETFIRSFGDQGLVGDICAPRYDGYFSKAAGTVYQAVLRARR